MGQDNKKNIVLLVDDQQLILKHLSRMLRSHFSQILTATTPAQAEQLLRQHEVTHIVCDYDLGDDKPRGTTLITQWRGQYSTIQRTVIMTGVEPSSLFPSPVGVDEILDKPYSLKQLLASLGIATETTS